MGPGPGALGPRPGAQSLWPGSPGPRPGALGPWPRAWGPGPRARNPGPGPQARGPGPGAWTQTPGAPGQGPEPRAKGPEVAGGSLQRRVCDSLVQHPRSLAQPCNPVQDCAVLMQPCSAPCSCVQPRTALCSTRTVLCIQPRAALSCRAQLPVRFLISCHVKARNTHCSISLSPSKGGGVPCHFRFEAVMINIPFPHKAGKHFHSVANTISNRHQGCKPFPAMAAGGWR